MSIAPTGGRVACDVVVLGLGPGGKDLATGLAEAGLDTVGVEMHLVGGECPFYGCTPSKLMIHAADHVAMVHRADHLAGPATIEPDWSRPARRIADEATHGWTDDANAEAARDAGVRLVRGHGRLVAPGVVEVDGVEYVASRGVVLNTGTAPLVLPIDGLAETPYWTNRDVVQVTDLPRSLVVLGGGPIGCELAQAMARFGVDVTVIEADDRLLSVEEPESSALLTRIFEAEGITVHTGVEVDRVEHDGTFVLTAGDLRVEADRLLDGGRAQQPRPRHRARGRGAGPGRGHRGDRRPDAGRRPAVGHRRHHRLSEAQAREQGLAVRTGYADLGGSARGWVDGEGNEGHVKLVADAATGLLVGATAMGRTGGDLVALLTLAIHARVPPAVVRRMHFAFPTYHGAVMTALDDLGL